VTGNLYTSSNKRRRNLEKELELQDNPVHTLYMASLLNSSHSKLFLWLSAGIAIALSLYFLRVNSHKHNDTENFAAEEKHVADSGTNATDLNLKKAPPLNNSPVVKASSTNKDSPLPRRSKSQQNHTCDECGGVHDIHSIAHQSLRARLSRSTDGLEEIELEDGSIAIDLNGGFQHASSARINALGEVAVTCDTSLAGVLHGPKDEPQAPLLETAIK